MENNKKRTVKNRYEDLFLSLSVMVEKWVVRTLIVLLGLLILGQALIQIPGMRYYLVKVEQLEGVPYVRSS